MSTAINRRETSNSNNHRLVTRDPFSFARELLGWDPFASRPSAFMPTFEVKETTESFVVRADLPGVKDADLDISIHNGVLSVSGARQAEERKDGESYYLYERQYGSFSRSFALPETADGERIDAKLDGGVLTLTIGKRVEARPRKIALQPKQ
jgi:HSP20 family protein